MRFYLFITFLIFSSIAQSQGTDLTVHYTCVSNIKATVKKTATQNNSFSSLYISKDKRLITLTTQNLHSQSLLENKRILILIDSRNQKLYSTRTYEDSTYFKQHRKNYGHLFYTNEKKIILGYACTKVSTTQKRTNGDSIQIYGWISDKLQSQSGFLPTFSGVDIPVKQIVLEQEWEDVNGSYKIIATEVSTKPIPSSIFNLSTKGYKEIQQKDIQNKKS